ncbi:hypothetical protein BGZ65_002821 [Modicella reniformis]|uniref:Uncharacterized protein n=1 Tax=Modicella reniformis TaxID=1440133 RepID=A0A9P6MHW2_9FUNG|nr:hypothetical protein BGZ65_002821 [Modicella reniformis]
MSPGEEVLDTTKSPAVQEPTVESKNESFLLDDSQETDFTAKQLVDAPFCQDTVTEMLPRSTQEAFDTNRREHDEHEDGYNSLEHRDPQAYPGQTECIRSGCPYPINIDIVRGIRHPYCSIECAKACGENPRVQVTASKQKQETEAPKQEQQVTEATCLDFKRLVNKVKSNKVRDNSAKTHYPSPPMTNESSRSCSDDEDGCC